MKSYDVPILTREQVREAFLEHVAFDPFAGERTPDGTLYFVRAESGHVKFGHTRMALSKRLAEVARSYEHKFGPLHSVGCVPAARREEERAHTTCRALTRTRGEIETFEWYSPGTPVAALVASIEAISGRSARVSAPTNNRRFGAMRSRCSKCGKEGHNSRSCYFGISVTAHGPNEGARRKLLKSALGEDY